MVYAVIQTPHPSHRSTFTFFASIGDSELPFPPTVPLPAHDLRLKSTYYSDVKRFIFVLDIYRSAPNLQLKEMLLVQDNDRSLFQKYA